MSWRSACNMACLYLLLCLLSRGALAQSATVSAKTSFEIWMPAVAALLGGLVSGILGPFLKDVVIQRWNERRSDQKLRDQIEQSYFAPLSASAEKIIWRMSEILLDKRPHFLMLRAHPKDYSQYKRLSTLYRIAALLGWIRAINLELNALPRGGFGDSSPVFGALAKVQSAMADGHGVEKRRFCSFCKICGIDVSEIPGDQIPSLAASFETNMYALVGDELKNDHRHLINSTDLHQEFVCRGLLTFLIDRKLADSLDYHALQEKRVELIGCLGYREALIYREWQDAIGDAMIMKDEHSAARRYRIIGFEEFEHLMASGDFNWIVPLREFIEDVDCEATDPTDERPTHLRDLAKAVADVLSTISSSSQGALVNRAALERARRVLALP